jgi:pimeloyl-ACP methyl ester carboxylesterase
MVSPNFNRDVLPTTTRLMLDTSLPLPMLRPLLRSELGELASRRGCHHPNSLSQDVIDMYRKPLHVKGWDKALQQMNTRKKEISSKELADALEAVAHMPTRIMSGQNDRAVPQSRIRAMASELPEAEVSFFAHCGHLPQEECPNELLEQMVAFIDAALKQSRDDGGQGKSPAVESPHPESSSRSLRMGPFASDEAFALSKLGLPSTPTP